MKIPVGKRAWPINPAALGICDLLERCGFLPGLNLTKIELTIHGTCPTCAHPVSQSVYEVLETGEIFAEGDNFCSGCGNRLATVPPQNCKKPLSQEMVCLFFGLIKTDSEGETS